MSLEKIIAEALAGRPLEMKEAFEAEIQTRIQACLEAEYMNVLEAKDEDEDIDLDEYSIDEIEEFMQTEDYENLDELSRDALKKYRDAAEDDRADVKRYGYRSDGEDDDKIAARKEREAARAHIKKRNQGIKTATRKIGDKFHEDYEDLDELSQDALRKYRDAAGDDRDDVKRYGMSVDGQKNAARKEREAAQALIKKRNQGIKTATRKIGEDLDL